MMREGPEAPRRMTASEFELWVAGPWRIAARRRGAGRPTLLDVEPAGIRTVADERHARLPLFDAARPGWLRGERLRQCVTQETSAKDSLVPDSVRVTTDDGTPLREGVDFRLDPEWAVLGRLPGGRLSAEQAVRISYRCGWKRLDSVVETPGGTVAVRAGEPHVCAPRSPAPATGERVLARLWIGARLACLDEDRLFPILETAFPEGPLPDARGVVRTRARLEAGGPLRVLAWGDSVTEAAYLAGPGFPENRWQEQFVARLRRRYPAAQIELRTAGWAAHNSRHFADAPPADAAHCFAAAVLDARPDLVVSEFVNDVHLQTEADVAREYGRFLADFGRIGAEWIIQTPHYVRPDWMGLRSEKHCDNDPRPHIGALRSFARQRGVPLTDASKRWGRLWRQGLPYTSLLLNAINHPDERGMALYADALMRFFL